MPFFDFENQPKTVRRSYLNYYKNNRFYAKTLTILIKKVKFQTQFRFYEIH